MNGKRRLVLPGRIRIKSARVRTALWVGLAVVGLATVIFGVSALSGPNATLTPIPTAPSAAETGRVYYNEALAALKSGDTTTAVDLLTKAVQADPTDAAAKSRLDKLKSRPPADLPAVAPPVSRAPVAPPSDAAFMKPVQDIGALLPRSVDGFEAGAKLVEGADAELPLDPATAATAAKVTRVLLSVHDRGSQSVAEAFVTTHMSAAYTKSRSSMDVHGVKASFGSDGTHLAAVIFSRGRFVFEAVFTAAGGDPGTLAGTAQQVANAFPTAP